jgi:hypothetical protein
MKTIRLLKSVLVGLACAGALNVLVFAAQAQIPAALGNLPLYFEAAPGRANHPAQFVARGDDYQFLISPAEAQLNLQKTGAATQKISSQTVRMQFVGAGSQAQIHGNDELPGKVNYLIGNNSAQWRTGVATFARVQVDQLYPGVNLVYYGNQRQLEYDFTLAPGANPDAIKIRFAGVDKISVDAQGKLVLAVGNNEILQPAPVIYQMIDGARKAVGGGYRILDKQAVAFTIGKYDHKLPLVIDPILSFSTYFGGNSTDIAWSVALDTNGFIYIAGQTLSSKFYATPGAFQTNFAGGSITGDAFIAKFDNQASNLIYCTYLGGSGDDIAYAITVDAAGHAYVAGTTDSANFPVTNAIPGGTKISGTFYPEDAFVTELETNGSSLIYSTYLGGSGYDAAYGIALDSSNDTYVTGITYSTNFPTSLAPYQKNPQFTNWAYQIYYNANAFVSEIGAGGSNLLYSTYLGGTNFDWGKGIAVDNSNNVYVTGLTASTNFPTKNAILQQLVQTNFIGSNQVLITNSFNGSLLNGSTNTTPGFDAFVAKFAPGCTSLIYSTFLGGTNSDAANSIAVDGSGNAYVTGWTISTNFPNTAMNVAGLYNGLTNSANFPYITNAFLTQITYNGTNAAIGYSAVFGGTNVGIDIGYGVAVDSVGDAFVVGASSTGSFPTTNTPTLMSPTNAGGSDAFVIAFNTNCSAILYSGYLGGSANDYGYGIAVDSSANVYIVGQTASVNFPIFNAGQPTLNGPSDAFLAKITSVPMSPDITIQPTNQDIWSGTTVSFISAATGTAPLHYQWQFNGTNLVNGTNGSGSIVTGATNTILTISNAQTNDSGNYLLVVTNFAGATNSSIAVLTVSNGPPIITMQPTNQLAEAQQPVTFNVTAVGSLPLSYQWQLAGMNLTNGTTTNGSTISGATSATLTITNVQTNDGGNYLVIVTNSFGSVTSSVAVLTVTPVPLITTQPTSQAIGVGSDVEFTVAGYATPPFYLQWIENGINLVNGGNISGVNTAVLTITNAQTYNNGNYWIVITNNWGSVTSSVVTLTVLTAPNFTGITASGTNGSFILNGTGGTNNGTYFVLTSTNLATPLAQWTPIATNQFASQGQFVFTNTPPINTPQLFYILQMQ